MRRESTILLSFLLGFCIVNAQQSSGTSYPTIGRPCPDFVLHNINYYKQGQAKLADFKGKWLILDFFTSSCGACIASFPHVSQEAKQFADKLTYMMVGSPDKSIGPMYERLREKLALPMPCAFDHGLFERWGIAAVPRVYLIDDQGLVRSISGGLTAEQIYDFIERKEANVSVYYTSPDSSMLYGSAFTAFQPKIERFTDPATVTSDGKSTALDCKGATLESMLNYAFWGDMSPAGGLGCDSTFYLYADKPILKTTDSLLFKPSYEENRNIFDYTLRLRGQVGLEVLRRTMREDICRFFRWSVSMESQTVPCLRLVAKAGAAERMRTRGGPRTVTGNPGIMDYSARNLPFRYFYGGLCDQLPHVRVLDQTGIAGNVDLSVNGPWVSLEDAQAGLEVLGLELVPDSVSVKVLMVKDRDNSGQGASSDISNARFPKPFSFEQIGWQEAMAKAKVENKLVMVYCYDRGNANCKWMDSVVFRSELLGDYLNGKVVALKYCMDSGDEVGQRFKVQYQVTEYPSFLFFSPNSRPLNLSIGLRDIHGLINLVAKSANPLYQYYTWIDEYRQGRRDSAFLYDLTTSALGNRQAVSRELVRNYLHWFILPAPPTIRWNKDNMELLTGEMRTNNDTAVAGLIYDNRTAIDAVNHDPKLAESMILGWVIFRYTFGQVPKEGVPADPDWRQIEKIFSTTYPAIDYHKRLLEKQWGWYKQQKDWGKFEKYVARFMDEYAANMDAGELSDRTWDIFLYCDDPRLLAKAVGWARTALEKSHHSPDMLETYAELLYKTHSKEDYLSMERQVADGDPNNKLAQAYYQKMKKGEPTWVR
jgi:thiol-disulfide isomerase/thioredoxin